MFKSPEVHDKSLGNVESLLKHHLAVLIGVLVLTDAGHVVGEIDVPIQMEPFVLQLMDDVCKHDDILLTNTLQVLAFS